MDQSSPNQHPAQYRINSGRTFGPLAPGKIEAIRAQLWDHYGITVTQSIEAASFSLAMVVRYALGLSATGGKVAAIVAPCFAGGVVLAGMRHLVNAGCQGIILEIPGNEPNRKVADSYAHQLSILEKMGVPKVLWESHLPLEPFHEALVDMHNVIFGVTKGSPTDGQLVDRVSNLMNEIRTPVHCVECPWGLNTATLSLEGVTLYASSTLSCGAVLEGLYQFRDYVGRHYICDLSIPETLTAPHEPGLNHLFSEQPVLQITPIVPEEPAEPPKEEGSAPAS
jgi:hypothetical protein